MDEVTIQQNLELMTAGSEDPLGMSYCLERSAFGFHTWRGYGITTISLSVGSLDGRIHSFGPTVPDGTRMVHLDVARKVSPDAFAYRIVDSSLEGLWEGPEDVIKNTIQRYNQEHGFSP